MSFLNSPLLLYGWPLIFLPIVIHLINRQRHRTVPWGAMMFLLDAKRLQRSMAKLRYWLIMAMRMLAIGGLLFAISRPLSSGWLGAAIGSDADTILVLLDRSPSMEQQDAITGKSKRETAIEKLSDLFETTGEGKRVVLIESTRAVAEEIDASQLAQLPNVTATDTEADIPRMLAVAEEYLISNEVGQADIWIASDLRQNDWRAEDGRWSALRDGFSELDGVRFHLLTYPDGSSENCSVSVSNVRKRGLDGNSELLLDVRVQREGENLANKNLQIEFVVNGARSVMDIEVVENEFFLQGHVIPIDGALESGWGKVEIPGDANPADNRHYFVFADESPRWVTIVSDDESSAGPLRIAAAASPDPTLQFSATTLATDRVAEIDWEKSTLLIWNAPLPTGLVAEQMTAFLKEGRPILFFPPENPDDDAFAGIRWLEWQTPDEPVGIGAWDNDSELLGRTDSGNALPVGKQNTRRYCKLDGVGKSLAKFTNGDPLLLRADGNLPAWFYATLPRPDASTLAKDGVVLYVMIQRAIELGAKRQGNARQIDTGRVQPSEVAEWQPVSTEARELVSSERTYFAGCYGIGDQSLAVLNRPIAEDGASIVSDNSIEEIFSGLDYQQITDAVGEGSPLANEIWRAFLALMAIALVVEAALCLG